MHRITEYNGKHARDPLREAADRNVVVWSGQEQQERKREEKPGLRQ